MWQDPNLQVGFVWTIFGLFVNLNKLSSNTKYIFFWFCTCAFNSINFTSVSCVKTSLPFYYYLTLFPFLVLKHHFRLGTIEHHPEASFARTQEVGNEADGRRGPAKGLQVLLDLAGD